MAQKSKTYKGQITIRRKIELSPFRQKEADDYYGPNLGYMYEVDYHNHPYFRGMEAFGGRTSLVVAERDTAQGREIETLNTIYTVGYTRKGYDNDA